MSFVLAHPFISAFVATELAGQYQQAQAQKQAAEYNARVAEMQAEAARRQGVLEQYKIKRAKRRMLGTQRALYAKAGLSLEGTPLEVLADTAAQYDLDLATSKYNTQIGVGRALYEASYQRYAGKQAYRAGLMGMGKTLLTSGLAMKGFLPKSSNTIIGGQGGTNTGLQMTPYGVAPTWSPY